MMRAELVFQDLLRLRRVARDVPEAITREVEPVIGRLEAELGETVSVSAAARLLGVSHTAVARWIAAGELLGGAGARGGVALDDLVDAVERVERVRGEGTRRRPLSVALRERLLPELRDAARDVGVEPARVVRWVRRGVIRSDHGQVEPAEIEWLRRQGRLVRELEEVASDPALDTMVLFGSAARGDDRADSDVDLLVEGPFAGDALSVAEVSGKLAERVGARVDVVTLGEVGHAPAVLELALRDGRPIKDAAGRWSALHRDRGRIRAEAAAELATYDARETAVLRALVGARR